MGLEYLFGLNMPDNGKRIFKYFESRNKVEEEESFKKLIDYLFFHVKNNPGSHIYHYAPYEVSAIKKLSTQFGKKEAEVDWLLKENKFIDNGLSKRIQHIDKLPLPAWHLLKPENYFTNSFTIGLAKGKLRNMPILATRGCPYQCTFCSSPSMWTTRYLSLIHI